MSIIKKPNGKYLASVGRGKNRKRRTFETRGEASRWEASEGGLVTPMTVRDAIEQVHRDEWRFSRRKDESRTRALLAAETILDMPAARVKPHHLSDITHDTIDAGLKPATAVRRVRTLCKALSHVLGNDAPTYKPPPHRTERTRVFTEEEQQAMYAWAELRRQEEPAMLPLLVFLFNTGARLGETARLTRRDVLPMMKQVTFRWDETKTERNRTVPMNDTLAEVMQEFLTAPFYGVGGLVFGGILESSTTAVYFRRDAWNRMREDLGFADDPEFVPHTCRHTFASRLVREGTPLKVVQELLGHASIVTTQRYVHLDTDTLSAATSKLG